MRLTDQIWTECSVRNLTGIDDIEKLQVTGAALRMLMREYEIEFGEKITTTAEFSEHIGMPVEVVQYIKDAPSKEYKIFASIF